MPKAAPTQAKRRRGRPTKAEQQQGEADSNNSAHAHAHKGPKSGKLVSQNAAPETMVTVPQASLKFMETLARRFDPDKLADKLDEIMQAETPPIVTKDGLVVTRPDYRTRLEGLKFVYAYVVGRPVERQEIINHRPPASMDDLLEQAKKSPVFLRTLMGMLQDMADEIDVTEG